MHYFRNFLTKKQNADLLANLINYFDVLHYSSLEQIIITNECNFLNRTLLNEYNRLYDSIQSLTIDEVNAFNTTTNSPRSNYTNKDLCPKRVGKCALEGGIMRSDLFQKKLLAEKVSYSLDDPKHFFLDPEIVDGTSLDFLFGNVRSVKCIRNNCYINGSMVLRNRLDLLSTTAHEKRLSVKYMHKFVEFMAHLEATDEFKYFDLSYHTSHTVAHEIEQYSKLDLRYVALSLVVFVCIYFILMSFHPTECKSNTLMDDTISPIKAACSFFVKSPVFLVLVTLMQFVFTVFSSLGLISLFGIPANSLLYTILFVILSRFFV